MMSSNRMVQCNPWVSPSYGAKLLLCVVVVQSIVRGGWAAVQRNDKVVNHTSAPCQEGWQKTKADFKQAMLRWTNPECYNFNYTFAGYPVGKPKTVFAKIRHFQVVGAPKGEVVRTMSYFINQIPRNCFSSCPKRGAKCNIRYNAKLGYPRVLLIDLTPLGSGGGINAKIRSFILVNCTPHDYVVLNYSTPYRSTRSPVTSRPKASGSQDDATFMILNYTSHDETSENTTSSP